MESVRLPSQLERQIENFDPGAASGRALSEFRHLYRQIQAQFSSYSSRTPTQPPPSPSQFFKHEDLGVVDYLIEQQVRQRVRKPRSNNVGQEKALVSERSKDNKRLQHLRGLRSTHWRLPPHKLYVDFGPDVLRSTGYLQGLRMLADLALAPYETVRQVLAEVREKRLRGVGAGIDRNTTCASCDIPAALEMLKARFPPPLRMKRCRRMLARDGHNDDYAEATADDAGDDESEIEIGRAAKSGRWDDFEDAESSPVLPPPAVPTGQQNETPQSAFPTPLSLPAGANHDSGDESVAWSTVPAAPWDVEDNADGDLSSDHVSHVHEDTHDCFSEHISSIAQAGMGEDVHMAQQVVDEVNDDVGGQLQARWDLVAGVKGHVESACSYA